MRDTNIIFGECRILHISSEDYRSKVRIQTHIYLYSKKHFWVKIALKKRNHADSGLTRTNMFLCGSKCDRIVSKVVLNQKCANIHLHGMTHLVVGVQEYTLA